MKIYYSGEILPLGYRKETDDEFISRLKEIHSKCPPEDTEDTEDIDSFVQPFRVRRLLIPLQEGETVILRTFAGEMEMSEAIEQAGLA